MSYLHMYLFKGMPSVTLSFSEICLLFYSKVLYLFLVPRIEMMYSFSWSYRCMCLVLLHVLISVVVQLCIFYWKDVVFRPIWFFVFILVKPVPVLETHPSMRTLANICSSDCIWFSSSPLFLVKWCVHQFVIGFVWQYVFSCPICYWNTRRRNRAVADASAYKTEYIYTQILCMFSH